MRSAGRGAAAAAGRPAPIPYNRPEMSDRLYVLRLAGELYTKARQTRLRFLRRLEANVRDALAAHGIRHRLERTWSRFYLETPDPAAPAVLSRVFGLQSVSELERRPWATLDDLVRSGEQFFRPAVAGRRFAVRASRRGTRDAIPFDSAAVETALGRALLPFTAGVDLGAPEVTAHVEVEPGEVHFFLEKVACRGGLPVGVEGRALALVSGGFDSAVAAWMLLKRGVKLDYLLCNLGGTAHREGALEVVRVLADRWSYGTRPRLYEVDLRPAVADLKEKADPQLWQLLLKRMMLRAAETVARRLGAPAVATGDAIGQVSSQTLHNLAVVSQVTQLAVLRPLVGSNKEEILAVARDVGLYEKAVVVAEYCGLAHRRPATRAPLGAVLAGEAALDPDLLAAAIAGRESLDLRGLAAAGGGEDLETDLVDPAATVLDLRSPEAFSAWHWPGALRLDLGAALAACASLSRERPYLVVCEVGWKSAHLVERMRQAGLAACHFRGGARALMRLAERERRLDPALLAPALREGPA